MSEKFFPMDSVSGDRIYYASDFAAYFADVINSGVSNNGGRLQISHANGMQLNVGPGIAWLKGHIYENTTTKTLTLSVGSSKPRIDRIVCRLNIPERLISTIVVEGTPAASAKAPELVRDGDYYDIGLATVLVRANAITIYEDDITDTRGDPIICGTVSIMGKENVSNKVSTITANSTNTQYPSAKAVFDLVKAIAGTGSGGNGKIVKDKIITMTSPSGAFLGDINGDGIIDNSDVIAMSRYIDGLTSTISDAADINGDGKIDSEDIAILSAFRTSGADKNKHTIARVTEHYTDDTSYTYYVYIDKSGMGGKSGITAADKQAIVNEVLSNFTNVSEVGR